MKLHHLPQEMLAIVYRFLSPLPSPTSPTSQQQPTKPSINDRSNFEKTSLLFRSICLMEERRELREIYEFENKYLTHPLMEEGVSEDLIEYVEGKIGRMLPFHLREFIKIVNGSKNYSNEGTMWHWSNILSPFKEWRYHSVNSLQIGIVHDVTLNEPTNLFIDLVSGKVVVQSHSIGTTLIVNGFKEWLYTCQYNSANPFDMKKLLEPSNENDLKKLLGRHGYIFSDLPDSYKSNKIFVKIALQSDSILTLSPESMRDDDEIARLSVAQHANSYPTLSERLRKDKKLFLSLAMVPNSLHSADESLKHDPEVVRTFIEKGGHPYYVPNDMINDELILLSLKNGSNVGQDVLSKSSLSTDFLIQVVDIVKPSSDYNIAQLFENINKGIVNGNISEKLLEKISQVDPLFLFIAGLEKKLPNLNKETALKLFSEKSEYNLGKIFENLPQDLKNDKKIVQRALIVAFYQVYPLINEEFKNDREFNLQTLQQLSPYDSVNVFKSVELFYDLWGEDEEFLRVAFNNNPEGIIEFPRLMDEPFVNSLDHHFVRLSFEEIMKLTPFQGYRLAVRRNKSHPAHDLVEAKDTLEDIRKALLPSNDFEEDAETLDDIRQSLLSSVWFDYW